MHVQGCGLGVMTRIEHGHSPVDSVLDNFMGLAGLA